MASSMVMLGVTPFLNNNSFSNIALDQGYNDNYSDSYSTYPTDDKKYECRTGPFEGFFVSSVEFCKHVKFDKDDNKRDNRTGTQGPPGPSGPAGAASTVPDPQDPRGFNGTDGEQGPPGITQLNDTNTYIREQNSTNSPNNVSSATIECDPDDFAISGGYISSTFGLSAYVPYIVEINSQDSDELESWVITFRGETDPVPFRGFVTCFNNP
ncbi:MAG: hypothetical protein ACR2F1_14200 [Nitrososphaeraceae archaeon]